MAALASLSTAANVAAMISLADMAFKSGAQVFDLYCRYKDASSSMSQLVDEIKAATTNTAQVRIVMQEFEASAFAIDNRHALPQIQQLLCLIDQEFKFLRKLMQDTRSSSSGDWLGLFQQLTSHIRWSLDDHKVAASCTRLQRLSTHMNNALGITGRRNEIVLRNELSATRAEVVKFTDTANILKDQVDVLVVSSMHPPESASHAMRLPLRNSRGRARAPKLARKQKGIVPTVPNNKSEVIAKEPLDINDPRSAVLRNVSLWHNESDVIEIESMTFEDMYLSIEPIKDLLRTAIDDRKLSKFFVMSTSQVEWIALLINQLLVHSHMARAISLSHESQSFATTQDRITTPCGMDICASTTQALSSKRTVTSFPTEHVLQRRRLQNGLWTTQTFSKTTPLAAIKAEICLIGDGLYSEILYFRMRFSANRQLSETGAAVDYASRYIKSLVRLDRQPFLRAGLLELSGHRHTLHLDWRTRSMIFFLEATYNAIRQCRLMSREQLEKECDISG